MGKPLKNPPVFMTLAQVKFNPILKLADFIPDIQESFRRIRFTDFEAQKSLSIQLTVQDKQSVPQTMQKERYFLGNVDKTHFFILDSQSLSIQSSDYGHFEAFSQTFLEGLNIVHDALQLAYTDRIGLRYLDRVMPQQGETIDQYLAHQVRGLSTNLGGVPVYSFTEALNVVDNIKLISRVVIQDGPLAFPPDLQPRNLTIPEKFTSYSGPSAVLDNDGFIEGRDPFSSDQVYKHLDNIHKIIGTAFRATTTPYALAAWDK